MNVPNMALRQSTGWVYTIIFAIWWDQTSSTHTLLNLFLPNGQPSTLPSNLDIYSTVCWNSGWGSSFCITLHAFPHSMLVTYFRPQNAHDVCPKVMRKGFWWLNTAIPALLPLFIAVEEVFTWDVVQSPRRSCLDVFNCPRMMSFEVRFELGE